MVMYYKAEVVAIFLASGKKQCFYMFKMISKTNKSRVFFFFSFKQQENW